MTLYVMVINTGCRRFARVDMADDDNVNVSLLFSMEKNIVSIHIRRWQLLMKEDAL